MPTNIRQLSALGAFCTNCYIVETADKGAVLIDAPCYPDKILSYVASLGLTLKAVLLTHGHCDHIEAVGELVDKTGCDVYIHKDDEIMLRDSHLCLAGYFATPFIPFDKAITFDDGEVITVGGVSFKVISTPGHTKGSVCYLMDDVIFSGDTLFFESIGRTDFPGGSYKTIINSIGKLKALGKDYTVLPGHSESTSLYYELEYNPFLGDLR